VAKDDLREVLEDIHAEVAHGILDDLRNGDKNARREALQLLKQNAITAAAMPETPTADLARMSGKLNFAELEQKVKVVPIRPPAPPSAA
jgi:hypothetical protein